MAKKDLSKSLDDAYAKMAEDVKDMEVDFSSMTGGNKAAGKRVRKTLMDIKKAAGAMRKESIELKNQ